MSKQEKIIEAVEKAEWARFQKIMWPSVAKHAALSKTHSQLVIWLVSKAFKMGMCAGMRILGSATLREFDLPTDVFNPPDEE